MQVLIADDDRTYHLLLKALLSKWGYDVVVTEDGQKALDILQQADPPRLAILDWMMPGLDGVQLCRRLSQKQTGPRIYTILLTAKVQKQDIITALDAGANDYVTKPFDHNELKSRVAVGARMIEYDRELDQKNQLLKQYAAQMEKLAQQRAKQLVHADRMVTLGTMSAGIAHEINNPASFISGNVQTIGRFWEDLKTNIQSCIDTEEGDTDKLKFIIEEMPQALDGVRNGVSRITRIVRGLKSYAHQDKGERAECDINESVRQALMLCHNRLKKQVAVHTDLACDLQTVWGCAQQLEQVLVNLCVNSADAMEQQNDAALTITTQNSVAGVRIMVQDTGPGIPAEQLTQIFDPFFTTKQVGKGTGLGLAISQGIIQDHEGTIEVENVPDGARFTIDLPVTLRTSEKIDEDATACSR